MRFIASIDTVIYGTAYLAGDTVVTTGWTRKQRLQMLGLGLLTAVEYHRQDYAGVTVDSGGYVVVAHTAGFVPSLVQVTSRSSDSFAQFWAADTLTATSARLHFADISANGVFTGVTGTFTAMFWV